MSRFTMIVRPDGKAVLTCQDTLSPAEAAEIRSAIAEWDEDDGPLLVIPECHVVQVAEIVLDLEAGVPA